MTTISEEAPDRNKESDQAASDETRPRVRRFAPRRSRSAALTTETTPVDHTTIATSTADESAAPSLEATLTEALTSASPAQAIEVIPAPQTSATRAPRPSRSRRKDASVAMAAPAIVAEAAPAIVADSSSERVAVAATAPETAAEQTISTPKPARSRRRIRPAAALPVASAPQVDAVVSEEQQESAAQAAPPAALAGPSLEQAAEPKQTARPTRSRHARARRSAAPATAAEAGPTGEAPQLALPSDPTMSTSEGRNEQATDAPPAATLGEQQATYTPATGQAETSGQPEYDLFDTWPASGQAVPSEDLDGAELLARALREMFPPLEATPETASATPDDNLTTFDLQAAVAAMDAALDAYSEGESGTTASETETDEGQRRRGRRGRRGGRGRRRTGLTVLPSLGPSENGLALVESEVTPPVAGTTTPVLQTVPAPGEGQAAANVFVPENPPRPEPSWREQRPRRNWGRTFSRDLPQTHVTMPPPKPSSTRITPIPQAVPPLAAVAAQPVALPHASTPFTMPDLRINEPLAPGETRTERLLDVQTRLLAAMLEQQARQIEVLTASVSSLHQAIQGMGANGVGSRTYQPRTGIFVDAPNVCYAAENARVTLDFARMLKYLSRDRQLVHALSYSPIIDDVREGIRYETQRFVAPFLRAGYKLITKPLKRFSDGSAKGNFDIELALDILTMAERLDIVVLVSGDSDFESVIQHIQSKGVRVEVVAFASNVSTELVNVADAFIDISQHLEHMRAL